MKLKDWLKYALPIPRILQTRYLLFLGVVFYALMKVYVAYTPSKEDDMLPDKLCGVMLEYFADEQSKPDPSSDYDRDGRRFGERD